MGSGASFQGFQMHRVRGGGTVVVTVIALRSDRSDAAQCGHPLAAPRRRWASAGLTSAGPPRLGRSSKSKDGGLLS